MKADPNVRYQATMATPFATLAIATDGRAVTAVRYLPRSVEPSAPADDVAALAVGEIERYLDDPAFRFTVPIAPSGPAFHRKVWDAIAAIPAGEARTYGSLARGLDCDPRAIGQACGANPIPLIVPCHRVVGAGGALGGFMGHRDPGVREPDLFAPPARDERDAFVPAEIKRWLLVHEGYRFGG
jgi:methylated-DNA-[protein]-cysteine S-methyltransferase